MLSDALSEGDTVPEGARDPAGLGAEIEGQLFAIYKDTGPKVGRDYD